jgi:glutamate dehydrogenase (NAD(P)+)
VFVLDEFLVANRRQLPGTRVAIQGFGNVGRSMARELFARGAKVVAVSDVSGGVADPAGLDIPAVAGLVADGSLLADHSGGDHVTNEELLGLDCDVLAPAALGPVLTSGNATSVQAKVVLEAANYPLTPGADKILEGAGVTVIPDILANAGGVTGSYFEWTQNIQQFTWKQDRFQAELEDRLRGAYRQVQATAERRHCSLRTAAFALGLERVAEATRVRGYLS